MDENKNYTPESWDSGIYGTGKTRPPKSHTGIIEKMTIHGRGNDTPLQAIRLSQGMDRSR